MTIKTFTPEKYKTNNWDVVIEGYGSRTFWAVRSWIGKIKPLK